MGTKAKCIKCGKENWINTTKLKTIHDTFNIKPREWLKSHYICKDCQRRIKLTHESLPNIIQNKINDFALDCKKICNGLFYASQTNDKKEKTLKALHAKMLSAGIREYKLLRYKNVIIGIELTMPIIDKIKINLI